MSIADISEDRLGGPREHERTPPHDILAEQSALGGMLLSKDAVADVIETLRGADFYIPKHELIFEAILTLYSHGEPTDVITVTDELIKTGELQRAGGADYLHTLTSIVPTAANAAYYASIVAERALLRRQRHRRQSLGHRHHRPGGRLTESNVEYQEAAPSGAASSCRGGPTMQPDEAACDAPRRRLALVLWLRRLACCWAISPNVPIRTRTQAGGARRAAA